jgi:hypothetical protein
MRHHGMLVQVLPCPLYHYCVLNDWDAFIEVTKGFPPFVAENIRLIWYLVNSFVWVWISSGPKLGEIHETPDPVFCYLSAEKQEP